MTDAYLPPARLPFPVTRATPVPVASRGKGSNGMPVMEGSFATIGDWYEVNSAIEGHFMERVAPRAFDRTVAESRSQMKVLYDHGKDPSIGNKVLGPIEDLTPDARYVVPLFDTSYNRDLAPGLEAGVYGSSHRFTAIGDEWVHRPERSDANPEGIPERTITEARVYEFGPVTFPANPLATAGTRSTTDDYYQRSADPSQYDSVLRSAQQARAPQGSPQPDARDTGSPPPDARTEPPEDHPPTKETPTVSETIPAAVTRAERPARITDLREQATRFTNEHTGALVGDEQERWDAMVSELRALEAAEAADMERRSLVAQFAADPAKAPPAYQPKSFNAPQQRVRDIHDMGEIRAASRNEADHRQLLRDCAMRSLETKSFPHPDARPDEQRGHIQHLLDHKDTPDSHLAKRMLATGNPGYEAAFNAAVIARQPGILDNYIQRYAALEVVGTTTTGGYAVPYSFDPTFIRTGAWTNINPYRTICRVEQIVGANVWTGVSVGAVLAAYDDESAATTEGGPTFAQPTYTAQRASSFVTLSHETMQDRPDIASELAVLIGEAKDTLEENQFSIGVGTTVYPSGMFVKSKFTVKETITDNVFAVADLDATETALPLRHRSTAVWMYCRAVIRIIQGWETAYGKLFNSTLGYPAVGNPALNPGGNTGMSLLGYPVWETPSAPATVTSDDTIVGILVSPKKYIIVDRVGMNVKIVPDLFDATTGFPNGTGGVLAIWRNTAGPLDAGAGRQVNIN